MSVNQQNRTCDVENNVEEQGILVKDEMVQAVDRWTASFEHALKNSDVTDLLELLDDPAYFRDNGALTYDYRQFAGPEKVASVLIALAAQMKPHDFRVSAKWPAPKLIGDTSALLVEAFVDFETKDGSAVLLLHARPSSSNPQVLKARALFTRLESLQTARQSPAHPRGRGYIPSYPGETWKQHHDASREYTDRDPQVIVVGAGQAGLVTSAFLSKLGVDTLILDRHPQVGDSWGKRYDSLFLHNPIEMNGFPFLPFPQHYPEYLPKDLIAEWLSLYARYLDLNVWTNTEFRTADYDLAAGRWTVRISTSNGGERELHPQHLVLATGGIGGKPAVPELPGLETFSGPVIHSSQYGKASDYGIKEALIVGVATSAHDIARDLAEAGVKVTMLQRGPLVVTNMETGNLAYAGYMDPELPTELVDVRYGIGLVNPLREDASRAYHKMAKEKDRSLLEGLHNAGLKLGDGVNGQGFLDLFLRSGGGYYLNTGTSELIINGKVKVEQFDRVSKFVPEGALLEDNSILKAGLIVLATGFQSRITEVADALGEDVAQRVGEVARLDAEGEWASMWGQTGQRGLWFNGGGINQMRPASERLALMIKADLDGLIPEGFRRPPKNSGEKPSYERT